MKRCARGASLRFDSPRRIIRLVGIGRYHCRHYLTVEYRLIPLNHDTCSRSAKSHNLLSRRGTEVRLAPHKFLYDAAGIPQVQLSL